MYMYPLPYEGEILSGRERCQSHSVPPRGGRRLGSSTRVARAREPTDRTGTTDSDETRRDREVRKSAARRGGRGADTRGCPAPHCAYSTLSTHNTHAHRSTAHEQNYTLSTLVHVGGTRADSRNPTHHRHQYLLALDQIIASCLKPPSHLSLPICPSRTATSRPR
jgi:hypothetical protein